MIITIYCPEFLNNSADIQELTNKIQNVLNNSFSLYDNELDLVFDDFHCFSAFLADDENNIDLVKLVYTLNDEYQERFYNNA